MNHSNEKTLTLMKNVRLSLNKKCMLLLEMACDVKRPLIIFMCNVIIIRAWHAHDVSISHICARCPPNCPCFFLWRVLSLAVFFGCGEGGWSNCIGVVLVCTLYHLPCLGFLFSHCSIWVSRVPCKSGHLSSIALFSWPPVKECWEHLLPESQS